MADACVSQGVSLLIWSSLPSVTKMTNGKITGMHHFDSKAKVEDYIREHVISKGVRAAFFVPAMYMQLSQTMFKPQPVGLTFFDLVLRLAIWEGEVNLKCRTDNGAFVAA